MICAWKELLSVLPLRMRQAVDQKGRESLQELRLRINAPPELVLLKGSEWLADIVTKEDLDFVINIASRYSPWSMTTSAQGYITVSGGHRIGICGEGVCQNGQVVGIRNPRSLCIRIARDFPGIAEKVSSIKGSILILGAPGWGKTTLLRDLIRQIGEKEAVCVIDERGELFPEGIPQGKRTDILCGCPKAAGMEMVLRTMGPDCIALDEITAQEDCRALSQAANCGVRLLATAHAASLKEFQKRITYRPLLENDIFQSYLVLRRDKSYALERIVS